MITHEQRREIILSSLARDTPKAFWEDARARARQTYLDIFHEVSAYPSMLPEQRMDKLYQDRFFRMEHLLSMLAQDHGFNWSPNLLIENGHRYVYATCGSVAMTQAYVPAIGYMPKAAKFRERLSAMNSVALQPRFAFGDDPSPTIFAIKEFYGLLVHNPVGKRFEENDQRLGMIQFCVPDANCNRWDAQFAIEEIVSAYAVETEVKQDRQLQWKQRKGDKKDGTA